MMLTGSERLSASMEPGRISLQRAIGRYRSDPWRSRALPGLREGRTYASRPLGNPADCAGVAVFLASSASAFVTGAATPLDGGYSYEVMQEF
jgi:NAD(P)-dependent dehydrogenase (short-subunit alcohol dehydrogenase family)